MRWFPLHTHAAPRGEAAGCLEGAVVAVETDALRLRRAFPAGAAAWDCLPAGATQRLLHVLRHMPAAWPGPAQSLHFTIERLPPGSLPPLARLRSLGVRLLQLYHPQAPNGYLHPLSGLTPDGTTLLRAMADTGIAVDLSHLSGPLLRHVLANAPGPRIVSHVVCGELLRPGIAARANAMPRRDLLACDALLYGVPFLDDLLSYRDAMRPEDRDADIIALARHIRRMAEIVGPERTALGPDLLCDADYAALGVRPVAQMDSARGLRRLGRHLRSEGLSPAQIEGIFAGNARRVLGALQCA